MKLIFNTKFIFSKKTPNPLGGLGLTRDQLGEASPNIPAQGGKRVCAGLSAIQKT